MERNTTSSEQEQNIEYVITYYGGSKATALTTDGDWVDYETPEMVARRYVTGEIGEDELEDRIEEAVIGPSVPVERAKDACHALQLRRKVERDSRTSVCGSR